MKARWTGILEQHPHGRGCAVAQQTQLPQSRSMRPRCPVLTVWAGAVALRMHTRQQLHAHRQSFALRGRPGKPESQGHVARQGLRGGCFSATCARALQPARESCAKAGRWRPRQEQCGFPRGAMTAAVQLSLS